MRRLVLLVILAFYPISSPAEMEVKYVTRGEREAAVRAAADWRQYVDSTAPTGVMGPDGVRVYAYGYASPVLVCAPMHACTIRGIAGERITSVAMGDTVRWLAMQAEAGDQPVIVVKPTQRNIRTNIVITTDQGRVYDVTLVAESPESAMRGIAFRDPAAEERVMQESLRARLAAAVESNASTPAPARGDQSVMPEGIRGRMVCDGSPRVLPDLVLYSDDRTYLAFSPNDHRPRGAREWPAVYAVLPRGESRMLHARRVGDAMVVDGVHDVLRLAIGTPGGMDEAVCRRPGAGR